MALITEVPRLPHPIMPTRRAELERDPKTVVGFNMVKAESAVAPLIKDLRSVELIGL
jgi:hypothetical protein